MAYLSVIPALDEVYGGRTAVLLLIRCAYRPKLNPCHCGVSQNTRLGWHGLLLLLTKKYSDTTRYLDAFISRATALFLTLIYFTTLIFG